MPNYSQSEKYGGMVRSWTLTEHFGLSPDDVRQYVRFSSLFVNFKMIKVVLKLTYLFDEQGGLTDGRGTQSESRVETAHCRPTVHIRYARG